MDRYIDREREGENEREIDREGGIYGPSTMVWTDRVIDGVASLLERKAY